MQYFQINSIEDLVANPSFKRWVLSGNAEDGNDWHQWAADNPEKLEWLAVAKTLIQILAGGEVALTAERVDAATNRILARLKLEETNEVGDDTPFSNIGQQEIMPAAPWFFLKNSMVRWVAAATVIAAIALGAVLWWGGWHPQDKAAAMLFEKKPGDMVFENNNDTVSRIQLADGSVVRLEKGGLLRVSANHNTARREVFLSGNAFFSVAHNPAKPFIVYTNDIVTKVLGTSFYIKALPGEKTASVAVVAGKVSVFKNENFSIGDDVPGVVQGLVITANQQASYDGANGTIGKALVATPQAVANTPAILSFDATPAATVFKKLYEDYGIPIIIDEAALASCSITASFKNQSFYDRLSIICQTINATYQVVDACIVVSSEGCK